MTAADGNAEHQHRTENQAEQGDASTPVFAGKRQQHRQFSCEHGGVQRTVKRAVRQRAQRRIRRKDRLKARLPDRQTEALSRKNGSSALSMAPMSASPRMSFTERMSASSSVTTIPKAEA